MVDVTEDFLVKARTYLGEEGKRVRNYFCCGLQDFSPEPSSYDVIWIQWVIGELPAAFCAFRRPPARPPPRPPLQRRVPGLLRHTGRGGFSKSSSGSPSRLGQYRYDPLRCSFLLKKCKQPITAFRERGNEF